MAFMADSVLDGAIAVLTGGVNRLDICSQEPTTYAEATSTYTLGNKTSPSLGSASNGTPSGRKTTVAAITDGSVTGTGTATHWALVATGSSTLLATGSLASSQAVTNGNTFATDAFDLTVLDATDEA